MWVQRCSHGCPCKCTFCPSHSVLPAGKMPKIFAYSNFFNFKLNGILYFYPLSLFSDINDVGLSLQLCSLTKNAITLPGSTYTRAWNSKLFFFTFLRLSPWWHLLLQNLPILKDWLMFIILFICGTMILKSVCVIIRQLFYVIFLKKIYIYIYNVHCALNKWRKKKRKFPLLYGETFYQRI